MCEALNRREREIMDLLHKKGRLSAQAVVDELADGTSNSTIRTLLMILEKKGYLQHMQEGKRYVYYPTLSSEKVGGAVLRRIVSVYFHNSVLQAVASLIESESNRLNSIELEELITLIEKNRREE